MPGGVAGAQSTMTAPYADMCTSHLFRLCPQICRVMSGRKTDQKAIIFKSILLLCNEFNLYFGMVSIRSWFLLRSGW